MTIEEKAAAWDKVAEAFTTRWVNGSYSWFCYNAAGGDFFPTQEEAVADLLAFLDRALKYKAHLQAFRKTLPPLE